MICAPIYGFSSNGTTNKPLQERKELMPIVNDTGRNHTGFSDNRTLRMVAAGGRLTKASWVHIPAAFSIDYQVSMRRIGRLTPDSVRDLVAAVDVLVANSKADYT